MSDWKPPTGGALDDTKWPETLVAKAIEPTADDDRLHGYSVLGDLARHYAHSDLIYLSLVGELPDEFQSTLFRVAMGSLATPTVNEAPSHAGLLGRICGGALASSIAAATIALADQARTLVQRHAELRTWLAAPTDAAPAAACDPADTAWVKTLVETLAMSGTPTRTVRHEMSRDAARLCVLFEAGLTSAEQMEAAIVTARISGVIAELLLAGPRDLGSYPVKLPPFHYVEDAP
jgi:hypothetical protein